MKSEHHDLVEQKTRSKKNTFHTNSKWTVNYCRQFGWLLWSRWLAWHQSMLRRPIVVLPIIEPKPMPRTTIMYDWLMPRHRIPSLNITIRTRIRTLVNSSNTCINRTHQMRLHFRHKRMRVPPHYLHPKLPPCPIRTCIKPIRTIRLDGKFPTRTRHQNKRSQIQMLDSSNHMPQQLHHRHTHRTHLMQEYPHHHINPIQMWIIKVPVSNLHIQVRSMRTECGHSCCLRYCDVFIILSIFSLFLEKCERVRSSQHSTIYYVTVGVSSRINACNKLKRGK